jgi:hypothetical protein
VPTPRVAPARGFRPRCRSGGAPSVAECGGPDPLALARLIPLRTGGHLHGSFTLHERRTENSNPSPCGPNRFPAGARNLTGSFSTAESGAVEAHGRNRALVSSEAQGTLPGSLSMSNGRGQANPLVRGDQRGRDLPASLRAEPGIRTQNLFLLREAPLPVGLDRLGAATGNRTRVFTMAR